MQVKDWFLEADVIIRRATRLDVDAIEGVIAPFVNSGKILPRTVDELLELIPSAFVAEIGERIVGFAALEVYSRKLGEIRSLCVADEFQGRGIGKRLIRACIDLARERNVFEIMAITSTEDIFRSCGFDFTLPGEKKALFIQTRDQH